MTAAIGSLTSLTGELRQKVKTVDSASRSQQQLVDRMGESLVQIERATRDVATCAEENAGASQELNAQAAALRQVAGGLRQLVG